MPQDVVVEREVGVGERVRARRALREVLDERAEAVAEPAEPAAADHGVAARLGQVLEPRERVVARGEQRARGAADDRAAAGPAAGQRERPRLVAQREQDPLGREGAVEFDDQTPSVTDGLRRRPDVRGLSSNGSPAGAQSVVALKLSTGDSRSAGDSLENCAFRRESHGCGMRGADCSAIPATIPRLRALSASAIVVLNCSR